MKRTDRRSDCPINHALELVGDSWSLLIIRDLMFKGKHTYADFSASEEKISTSVLADRLRSLVDSGIIVRVGSGRSTRYELTRKGADLLPMLVEMIAWSARHDPLTAAPQAFVEQAKSDRDGLLAHLEAELIAHHPSLGPRNAS
jgi:DNA-binding HxlR family transcriptional regulator